MAAVKRMTRTQKEAKAAALREDAQRLFNQALSLIEAAQESIGAPLHTVSEISTLLRGSGWAEKKLVVQTEWVAGTAARDLEAERRESVKKLARIRELEAWQDGVKTATKLMGIAAPWIRG